MAKIVFTYGTGEKGHEPDENGATRLKNPKGLYIDPSDGSLLVADAYNDRCLRFSKGSVEGKQLCGDARQISEYDEIGQKLTLDHQLDRPYALCTDLAGKNLLVSDSHNCRLLSFDAAAKEKMNKGRQLIPQPGMRVSTGAPEAIKYPRCIFPVQEEDDGAPEKLLVVDTWSHRVLLVSTDPGSTEAPRVLAGVPNSFGTRTDQLAYPTSAAFLPGSGNRTAAGGADKDEKKAQKEEDSAESSKPKPHSLGTLLVSDTSNNRVMRFEPGEECGSLVLGSLMCTSGNGPEELDTPVGLCICPKTGALIIADKNNHRLLRVRNPREATPKTANAEVLLGPEELKYPWFVCFDADGFLYVSDEGHHRVLKLELKA